MAQSIDQVLLSLKALSDPTRLRIASLLRHGELTVSDLVDILGQSQPRLSRHLKLLCEANLASRNSEGAFAYFRLTESALLAPVLDEIDPGDIWRSRDEAALFALRARREEEREAYFAAQAEHWDRLRTQHAPAERVEAAVREALPGPYEALLDIGTGTGRMLELLADRFERGLGLDTSPDMLRFARTRIDKDLRHARVRRADARAIDPLSPDEMPEAGFDAVVIHQVLRHIDRPARVLSEAARLMAPEGVLLLVDFAPHDLTFLKAEHQHQRLGLSDREVEAWADEAGLDIADAQKLEPDPGGRITVVLWRLTKRAASQLHQHEAA
ncbi:MAG: metalloregulator ArsR/SmtB family transcription factor [Pseudomonadota bacterium]